MDFVTITDHNSITGALEIAHLPLGVTCLVHVCEDIEGSGQLVATGSFDQTVRIWTTDGQPLHSFILTKTITALTYVPHHRALWIADGRKVHIQTFVKRMK